MVLLRRFHFRQQRSGHRETTSGSLTVPENRKCKNHAPLGTVQAGCDEAQARLRSEYLEGGPHTKTEDDDASQFVWSVDFSTLMSKPFSFAMPLTFCTMASSRSCLRVKIHKPLSLVPVPVLQPSDPISVGGPPLTRDQPSVLSDAITQ